MLDNVTAVLLIAPVTILVCDRLAIPGGADSDRRGARVEYRRAATLVGDPPNIIIASQAGLSYNDFLIHVAPIIVLLLVMFVVMCRWLFRKAFRYDPVDVNEEVSHGIGLEPSVVAARVRTPFPRRMATCRHDPGLRQHVVGALLRPVDCIERNVESPANLLGHGRGLTDEQWRTWPGQRSP